MYKRQDLEKESGGPPVAVSANGTVVVYAIGGQIFVWYDHQKLVAPLERKAARNAMQHFSRFPGLGEYYGVPSKIAEMAYGEVAAQGAGEEILREATSATTRARANPGAEVEPPAKRVRKV